MSKTIKQLADEFGVSKTAIRKRFTDEFKEKYVQTTSEGSLQISDDGCKLIAESLRKHIETLPETEKPSQSKFAETCENSGFRQSIDIQKETIDFLKEQLELLSVKDCHYHNVKFLLLKLPVKSIISPDFTTFVLTYPLLLKYLV